MERIICLIIGYAFGLFQTGYFVGKLNHVDIRKTGSGNFWFYECTACAWSKSRTDDVFAGDVLKCVLPILLVRQIFSGSDCLPLLAMYTGAGATLGHNYPFYLKFKGGKGIGVAGGRGFPPSSGWFRSHLLHLFLWWQSPAMFPQGHFW